MAIQQRRGAKADFDATKMLPGELAVTTDGSRKVYVAFTPGDAKELASTEDVEETIQSGIEEIEQKKEEALAQFPNYEEKLAELEVYKANSIISTSSGTVIHETDCAAVPPINIKLFGKSKQNTVPGNQLFDVSKFPTTTIGNVTLTNNGDGSLTISGNGNLTERFELSYTLSHEETVKMFKSGIMYGKFEAITYPYFSIELRHSGGSYGGLFNLSSANQTFNITQDMLNDENCVFSVILLGVSGQQIKGGTFKPMIYQNGDGIFETYVGGEQSPNMNYPQIPEFLGESGSIGGKVLTGNFFDISKFVEQDDVKVQDNGFVFTNTYGEGSPKSIAYPTSFGMLCPDLKDGDTVYLQFDGVNVKYNEFYLLGTGRDWFVGQAITITQADLDKSFYIYGNYNQTCVLKNIIVSKEPLPYEPYTEQPFTFQTPNGLRGIPLGQTIINEIKNSPIHMNGVYLDAVEQQYYIADTVENGEHIQRIDKLIFTGDETYTLNTQAVSNGVNAYHTVTELKPMVTEHSMCTHLTNRKWEGGIEDGENVVCVASSTVIVFRTDGVQSVEEFVADVKELYQNGTPLTLYFVLANPVITDGKIEQQDTLVTNYPNTTIVNDEGAYMEVEYVADTKKHIEQNYVSKEAYNEHENRIAELEKAIVNS